MTTRAAVHAAASAWADDPGSVVEIPHADFNADPVSGGYAYLCDKGVLIGGVDGGRSWSVDPGDDAGRRALIERTWAEARHRHRPLPLADLSPLHRAAIDTLARGLPSVAALDRDERPGVEDAALAQADHVLVVLRRHTRPPVTEEAALRALAANDWLLEVPDAAQGAHPCPLCGNPAIGGPRYPAAVCDDCYPRTACGEGRTVRGQNTSIGGGFEARHVDDDSVCGSVTDDGRCWIGDRECRMGEARFGGVYVVALPPGS